ncbi:FAD-dependent monooxygenase [Variovorax terrae]|uniref:FAD-dependent monooxygenase n=1 Tax=Variovorax terrae TaxID=2923278 RepID=A0A9X2APH4_9BURK|nr:FAD-dependent monooxygenase [Variovorax terrae]MCJ0762051.1 FAD-dependent monooxygenase [Variovorax terrae]
MAQPYDICIRGAGIVGRTLALLLARERLRVGLLAQPPGAASGASDVRAYALNAASKQLLDSLRSWPDARHATAVQAMQVHGDDGGEVNFSAEAQGAPALAWIVDVPALEARLAEAVRYQPLIDVLEAPAPAALTVVCEGRASTTREEFAVDFEITPYPQRAIAARVSCEQPHRQVARQWFSPGEILAFLPLDGPQGNSVAVVWSVLQERTAGLLALEADGFAAQLEAASHQALGRLTLASERAAWPLQLARARHWVGRRGGASWALAGDAAHTVHPLAGQGLNLGLADAAELARVLHEREYWRGVGDEKLLRRYERARKADVLSMGATTDGLQQLFAQPGSPWQALRNWGMKGFERSGPLKTWVARQAMGLPGNGLL